MTTLPGENLTRTVDESWCQNIFSTLCSPYVDLTWALVPVVLVCVVWICQRKSRA